LEVRMVPCVRATPPTIGCPPDLALAHPLTTALDLAECACCTTAAHGCGPEWLLQRADEVPTGILFLPTPAYVFLLAWTANNAYSPVARGTHLAVSPSLKCLDKLYLPRHASVTTVMEKLCRLPESGHRKCHRARHHIAPQHPLLSRPDILYGACVFLRKRCLHPLFVTGSASGPFSCRSLRSSCKCRICNCSCSSQAKEQPSGKRRRIRPVR